ncbi:salt stress-induced protein-like [Canna indica]|uniref:Salt stress-induced protein-like n=1 Tax=Canna indica TaxID=4628 RepID=A0AAQ3KB31_9LILI|nr:salt stress-induced protein-like [Canna indica]
MASEGVMPQGPWGSNRGSAWDMGIANHISNIKIHYIDVIDGISITFDNAAPFRQGQTSNLQFKELNLAEGEYVNKISGRFQYKFNENVILTQLSLETDKGQSIATPDQAGNTFSLTLEPGHKVVGFFGLLNTNSVAISAIGVNVVAN